MSFSNANILGKRKIVGQGTKWVLVYIKQKSSGLYLTLPPDLKRVRNKSIFVENLRFLLFLLKFHLYSNDE